MKKVTVGKAEIGMNEMNITKFSYISRNFVFFSTSLSSTFDFLPAKIEIFRLNFITTLLETV